MTKQSRKWVSNRTLEFLSAGVPTPENPSGLEVVTIEPGDTLIVESQDEAAPVAEMPQADMMEVTEPTPAVASVSSQKPAKDFRSSALKGSALNQPRK